MFAFTRDPFGVPIFDPRPCETLMTTASPTGPAVTRALHASSSFLRNVKTR